MYNFEDEAIPLFFPVSEGAQLKPWFTTSILDKGLDLIREQRVTNYHCIRNAVGAIIDNDAVVALQFEKSTKLSQGFIIRDKRCDICGSRIDDTYCMHLAALVILSLTVRLDPTLKVMPTAFVFTHSNWFKLGTYLNKWLSRTGVTSCCYVDEGGEIWRFSPAEGLVRAFIPESWLQTGRLFYPGQTAGHSVTQDQVEHLSLLERTLRDWTMTSGESALLKTGNRSIGWQRDNSFWIWLVRMLFMIHGETLPDLQWDAQNSSFFLQIGAEKRDPGAIKVILPKAKTWELVRDVRFPSRDAEIMVSAKECFRVFFNSDNSVEVQPSLSLADGRILSRHDPVLNHLGDVYYLEGEGFLPTRRIPSEGTLRNPSLQTSALPLLAFAQSVKVKDESFTVAVNDVQNFLESNWTALRYSDNVVDTELLDIQVHDLPDRLVIDSFEERDNWCYLSLHYGLGNTSITPRDIKSARAKRLTCIPGIQWLQIDKTPLSWLYNLPDDRFDPDDSNRIRLTYREIIAMTAVIPEVEIAINKESPRNRLSGLIDVACWTDDTSLSQVPGHLRSYQRNGLAWMIRLYRLGIGGLLADDMGLGKTHQGLALLQQVARDDGKCRMLVICPASVVLHWADKIDKFYKDLSYTVYYGARRDLEETLNHGVILTTFGVVRRDLEKLLTYSFDIILVDEIQHLKNRKTATHQAVSVLKGAVKIGLTGTPIENSLQDLRSLFDICLPGLLGSERDFDRLYVQPITVGGSIQARDQLGALVNPFILRRSRGQVLTELPEIIEDDRLCELTDDQVGLYRKTVQSQASDLEHLASKDGVVPYMNILAVITRLKRICCHPCLVQESSDFSEYQSGKWDLLVELISELVSADMKCVVFSQYTGMIALMENYLQAAGIGFCSLKGNMAVGKRQKMIDRFNGDPSCRVFCASLLAGGVGIDLTAAQAVIHYDRWWNPAREEQATARVHRMGQDKVVQVFRLITRGTLEEKIHNLIMKKRQLATTLIQEDEAGIIKQMDRKQLMDLFR